MIDLGLLDGRVARASASLQRGGDDPLGEYRDVSGKNAYDALKAYEAGPVHGAHRDALLRWIAFFTEARIGWDLVLEEAEREKAPDPRLETARKDLLASTTFAKTWEEARAALFQAPNVVELEKALTRLDELADPIAAVRRERRARTFEVARRIGLEHPWANVLDREATLSAAPAQGQLIVVATAEESSSVKVLRELSDAVLEVTEPLARDWLKRVGATPALVIESTFARDATEGWPARLTARWLEDAFKTIAPRTPRDAPLPEALGGASFLRAAAAWGYALRTGSTAKSLPFALARDPAPTDAFVYGDLLALAVASRTFARRKLDLPVRVAEAQERALARTAFVALRELAVLVRLGLSEGIVADDTDDASARVFGRPLPHALGMVWAHGGISGRRRSDAGARFLAALRAWTLRDELVQMHDEDWFDNPRAAQRLANVASGPIRQSEKPDPTLAPRIARAFEEAMG